MKNNCVCIYFIQNQVAMIKYEFEYQYFLRPLGEWSHLSQICFFAQLELVGVHYATYLEREVHAKASERLCPWIGINLNSDFLQPGPVSQGWTVVWWVSSHDAAHRSGGFQRRLANITSLVVYPLCCIHFALRYNGDVMAMVIAMVMVMTIQKRGLGDKGV